jgi:hypothetical protein
MQTMQYSLPLAAYGVLSSTMLPRVLPRVGWSGNERLLHTESVLQLVMHLLPKHQQQL